MTSMVTSLALVGKIFCISCGQFADQFRDEICKYTYFHDDIIITSTDRFVAKIDFEDKERKIFSGIINLDKPILIVYMERNLQYGGELKVGDVVSFFLGYSMQVKNKVYAMNIIVETPVFRMEAQTEIKKAEDKTFTPSVKAKPFIPSTKAKSFTPAATAAPPSTLVAKPPSIPAATAATAASPSLSKPPSTRAATAAPPSTRAATAAPSPSLSKPPSTRAATAAPPSTLVAKPPSTPAATAAPPSSSSSSSSSEVKASSFKPISGSTSFSSISKSPFIYPKSRLVFQAMEEIKNATSIAVKNATSRAEESGKKINLDEILKEVYRIYAKAISGLIHLEEVKLSKPSRDLMSVVSSAIFSGKDYNFTYSKKEVNQNSENWTHCEWGKILRDEDEHIEYKSLFSSKSLVKGVTSYIKRTANSFINSEDGGCLFIGVTDKGSALGLYVEKDTIEEIKRTVEAGFLKFNPPVKSSLYRIDFIPLTLGQIILPNLYIIRIKVYSGLKEFPFYSNESGIVYTRGFASSRAITSRYLKILPRKFKHDKEIPDVGMDPIEDMVKKFTSRVDQATFNSAMERLKEMSKLWAEKIAKAKVGEEEKAIPAKKGKEEDLFEEDLFEEEIYEEED